MGRNIPRPIRFQQNFNVTKPRRSLPRHDGGGTTLRGHDLSLWLSQVVEDFQPGAVLWDKPLRRALRRTTPLLPLHPTNNPYAMNYRFIATDTLQKLVVLTVLFVWSRVSDRSSLEWSITLFSLSTLPNTLVMGIPLLKGMYGDDSGTLMVQIVALQYIIWVDSNTKKESLQTEAEVGEDGKLHVTVRKSTSARSEIYNRHSHGGALHSGLSLTLRASNLTNAEIYSLQSSRNHTPRASSFNHTDFYSMVNVGKNLTSVSPRGSNFGNLGFDEEAGMAQVRANPAIRHQLEPGSSCLWRALMGRRG
ncbi:hypothetical protein V2J09_014460 [Rumex salicifolius]